MLAERVKGGERILLVYNTGGEAVMASVLEFEFKLDSF
jgi:hypothetical protein